MIAAVHHSGRAHDVDRKRSASSGPVFSVPCLPVGGFTLAGMAPAASFTVSSETDGAAASFGGKGVATAATVPSGLAPSDLQHWVGRSAGSGQCVALAQAVQPGVGPTRTWACGDKVQGNTSLQPGTVIATFDSANRYANAIDGSSHAAIYLGQNAHGVQVLDQWAGSAAAVRTIPWTNPSGVAANTGSAFHVVKSG